MSPTDPTLEMFAVEASQVLYELSGRRFSGLCEETVRPCGRGCGFWAGPYGIVPGWGGGGETWGGGLGGGGVAGVWGWYGEGGVVCGCQALCEVLLGYPVVEVTEVKIDGAVVDPTTYRVDEWKWLVRLTDPVTLAQRCWPACQDLALADTEPGTFSVTYTHGVAPPPIGASAAAQLACQLYLSCAGATCSLPTGATKITRQGITIERGLLANWFVNSSSGSGWTTGLGLVDAFLTAYNPSRLRRAPAVWTPDVVRRPRRVGT